MSRKLIVSFFVGMVFMPGLCVCADDGESLNNGATVDCGDSVWNPGAGAYIATGSADLTGLVNEKDYFLAMVQWVNIDEGYVSDLTVTGGFWWDDEESEWVYTYGFFQGTSVSTKPLYFWLYKSNQSPGTCLTQLWHDRGTVGVKDGSDTLITGETTGADF